MTPNKTAKIYWKAAFSTVLCLANLALLYVLQKPESNLLTGDVVSVMFAITAAFLAVDAARDVRTVMRATR
jgi:hypothetical protein